MNTIQIQKLDDTIVGAEPIEVSPGSFVASGIFRVDLVWTGGVFVRCKILLPGETEPSLDVVDSTVVDPTGMDQRWALTIPTPDENVLPSDTDADLSAHLMTDADQPVELASHLDIEFRRV